MVKYFMFCVCVTAGFLLYSLFPVSHGPGITASGSPEISSLNWQEPFTFKGATIIPKKIVSGEVRVLDKRRYFIDEFSDYAPLDIVAGWNEMSDERNINFVFHDLFDRRFETKFTTPPIEIDVINMESDLWHLIPSSSAIFDEITHIRRGHIIRLSGMIVDIQTDYEFQFNSAAGFSKTEHKKGFAIWVEEFEIL